MDSVRKDLEKIIYCSKDFRVIVVIVLLFFLSKDIFVVFCLINGVMCFVV